MIMRWILAALTAALLLPASVGAEKLPSAYDGSRDGFLPNGKHNMPFKLYGVAIQWHLGCLKGKTAQCLRLAAAFENGAGDIRPDMRVAIAYFLKSCEFGSGSACARAASILRDGSAGFTNEALARNQGDRGCTVLKDQSACPALAGALAPGDGRTAALADNACASGADEGCRIKAATLFYERKDAVSRAASL